MQDGRTLMDCDALVRSAYEASLKRAEEKGAKSIGFSLISAGVFRGVQTLENVLRAGVVGIAGAAYPCLEEVHLVGFTREEKKVLLRVAAEVVDNFRRQRGTIADPDDKAQAQAGSLFGLQPNSPLTANSRTGLVDDEVTESYGQRVSL